MTTVESDAVKGFDSPRVCAMLRVPPSTLNAWANDRLVVASLLDTTGRRSTRYWTPEDFVLVRLVKALRDSGCSHDVLSRARPVLEEAWASLGRDDHFYWDGDDLIEVTAWGDVQSRLQRPGQYLIHYLATPLRPWLESAYREATWFSRSDYIRLKARRDAVMKSKG